MDKQTIVIGIQELERNGFGAVDAGDHIIVRDPIHQCGTGTNAGRLILVSYTDRALRSGNAVTKFLYDRS